MLISGNSWNQSTLPERRIFCISCRSIPGFQVYSQTIVPFMGQAGYVLISKPKFSLKQNTFVICNPYLKVTGCLKVCSFRSCYLQNRYVSFLASMKAFGGRVLPTSQEKSPLKKKPIILKRMSVTVHKGQASSCSAQERGVENEIQQCFRIVDIFRSFFVGF